MKILDIRNYFDLSKNGFAKILGVTSNMVEKWEKEQNRLTEPDMNKFYEAFKIRKKYLLNVNKNFKIKEVKIKKAETFNIVEFRNEYYNGYSIYSGERKSKILLFFLIVEIFVFICALFLGEIYTDGGSTEPIDNKNLYLLESNDRIMIVEVRKKFIYVSPFFKRKKIRNSFSHRGYVYSKSNKIE